MKKAIFIVILLVILGGCAKEIETSSVPYITPYKKGENFEIYDIRKYGYPEYQYFIFDTNNDVLDYDVINKEPKIAATNGLTKVCIGAGTGLRNCRYYDSERLLISDWFINPIIESDAMVVYLDASEYEWRLVVQDIFDKSKYYRTLIETFHMLYIPFKS